MTLKRTAAETAAITALVGLCACHSKPTAASGSEPASTNSASPVASASVDPCSVLTAAEVTAVTGDKVIKTEAIDHDCLYHSAASDDGTRVSIYATGGGEQMDAIKQANNVIGGIGNMVSAQGDVGKDVQRSITAPAAGGEPALGDETVWSANDMLAVRKGDVFVQVTPPVAHDRSRHAGVMVPDAEKRVIAQKLAAQALGKLAH